MITLEVADLVVIASRTLGLDTGQVLDLLDAVAAEFALAQARPGRDPGDLAGQAAALLDALVRGQPLRRGNQQVALAAMLQFLALNGQEMDPNPPGPVAALVAGLAAGTLDVKTVAERLASRLRPVGQPAARVKEAPMPGRPVSLAMRIKEATMRTQPKGMFGRFTDRRKKPGCCAMTTWAPGTFCWPCCMRERASPRRRWTRSASPGNWCWSRWRR